MLGVQVCQMDMTLGACTCGGGGAGTGAAGTAGGAGITAAGTGGDTGGGSGSGSSTGDDAGTTNTPDGGAQADSGGGGGGGGGTQKPPTDGTQNAACNTDNPCENGLECYTAAGATTVGYCTKTCTADTDCADLTGGTYTCSSAAGGIGGGGTRYCRINCMDANDTSCPALMSCQAVTGGFRCLYDEKDLGSGAAGVWEACIGDGDCGADLTCYNPLGAQAAQLGYQGACVQSCTANDECTSLPTSGDITPACSTNTSQCRLTCSGGGTCPDGMTCVMGIQRCMFQDTSGGV